MHLVSPLALNEWLQPNKNDFCQFVHRKKKLILTSKAKEPSLPPFLEMLGLLDHKTLREDVFPVDRDLLSHVSTKNGWQNSDLGHKDT